MGSAGELTVEQAARQAHVSAKTIRRWIADGYLPARQVRKRRQWLIDPAWLELAQVRQRPLRRGLRPQEQTKQIGELVRGVAHLRHEQWWQEFMRQYHAKGEVYYRALAERVGMPWERVQEAAAPLAAESIANGERIMEEGRHWRWPSVEGDEAGAGTPTSPNDQAPSAGTSKSPIVPHQPAPSKRRRRSDRTRARRTP